MSAIRRFRMLRGSKALDLARAAGIHPSAFSMVENGRRAASPERRAKIAELLGVEESRLFRRDGLVKAQ
jgi:transcriptional regulator with XRE-family HTH domain